RCDIDPAQPDCRPTGESCTSGHGSGCCDTCDNDDGRCGFGPTTCRAQGVGCTADSDCCKGKCLPNDRGTPVCVTRCLATAPPCSLDAECCSFSCNANTGQCNAPAPLKPPDGGTSAEAGATCLITGQRCSADVDCCTRSCIAGYCDVRCRYAGVKCT